MCVYTVGEAKVVFCVSAWLFIDPMECESKWKLLAVRNTALTSSSIFCLPWPKQNQPSKNMHLKFLTWEELAGKNISCNEEDSWAVPQNKKEKKMALLCLSVHFVGSHFENKDRELSVVLE